MFLRAFTKFLYGFFGIVFIIIGGAIVSFKTGMLPEGLTEKVLHAAENNMNSLHLLQEFGSMLLFAGVISFWAIRNYEQSMGFHWCMTVFWASLSFIHWLDVRGMRSVTGPLINTIPVTLFLITGVLRRRAKA